MNRAARRLPACFVGMIAASALSLSSGRSATAGSPDVGLSKTQAAREEKKWWSQYADHIQESRAAEIKDRALVDGDLRMPFWFHTFGPAPARGHSLFISMHGGGEGPPELNDQQWENQKHLYQPAEGIYLAPRAPDNHWNMWHEPHIDRLFQRLIADLVVLEHVDPNRIYLTGYSAGGDGVYQLAPRMADHLAAAAMMAGHPNDASPLGLRNLPFAIHVGALDAAFNRNKIAAEWGEKLDALRKDDPGGYVHLVQLHAGKAHWMDREDAAAIPWMAGFSRNPWPKKVVWKQAAVTHHRFYWLAVPPGQERPGALVTAEINGQQITVTGQDTPTVLVRLNDHLVDLDQPVRILANGKLAFEGVLPRSLQTLQTTLEERGDPDGVYSAQLTVPLQKP